MKIQRKPLKIFFKNGYKTYTHELAQLLAIQVFQMNYQDCLNNIDRRKTPRKALQQLLLYYDEEVKKREDWEKNIIT